MKKRHRIFIAINLPQDVKKFLAGYQKKFSELPAKWVSAENLHITLVFLGDLTDEELGGVCLTVKEVVKNHNSFDLQVSSITYGPDGKIPFGYAQDKPPRMVWALGDKSKELALLKKDLQDALLQKVAFVPETKLFILHVTLARISAFAWRAIEPAERPDVSDSISLPFSVESVEVMESALKRGGPQYTIIESFQLKN